MMHPHPRRRSYDTQTMVAFVLLAIMFALGLWRGEENRKEATRQTRAAAIERTDQIKEETRRRTQAIQNSRVEVIIRSCRQTNRTHDRVIARLDRIIAAMPPGPERERAIRNRASTVFLLEALAPHRDCALRADRLVHGG